MRYTESEVTQLLEEWSRGDAEALDRLMPVVFDEVRELARRRLARESPAHTLQPTAVVNEVYLRLSGRRTVSWKNRDQFFGFLADLMRRILVDHARRHLAAKRGSPADRVPLDSAALDAAALDAVLPLARVRPPELVALDEALETLAQVDARKCRIVELQFFVGLTQKEIAEVLDISLNPVNREWAKAKMWLRRELGQDVAPGRGPTEPIP